MSRILQRFFEEKMEEFGKHMSSYQEGFTDAIDICDQKIGNCLTCKHSIQEETDSGISCAKFSNFRDAEFVRPDFYCGYYEAKR